MIILLQLWFPLNDHPLDLCEKHTGVDFLEGKRGRSLKMSPFGFISANWQKLLYDTNEAEGKQRR